MSSGIFCFLKYRKTFWENDLPVPSLMTSDLTVTLHTSMPLGCNLQNNWTVTVKQPLSCKQQLRRRPAEMQPECNLSVRACTCARSSHCSWLSWTHPHNWLRHLQLAFCTAGNLITKIWYCNPQNNPAPIIQGHPAAWNWRHVSVHHQPEIIWLSLKQHLSPSEVHCVHGLFLAPPPHKC